MIAKKQHVSEGSHYYTKEGAPVYEVEGAKGKMVKTTVAHARKLNLFPSVTTVTGIIAKTFVDNWRIDMYLKEAHELREQLVCLEEFAEFRETLMEKVEPKLNEGATRGSEIHAELEKFFKGEPVEKHQNIIENVRVKLASIIPPEGKPIPELSFCVQDLGYAGKMDLPVEITVGDINEFYLLDFKTTSDKNFKGLAKKPYDDYAMQLSAYGKGLPKAPIAYYNVIINRDTGEVDTYQWSQFDIEKGFAKFACLLEYWKQSNNYRPEDMASGDVIPFG